MIENSTCIWRRRLDSNPGQLVGDECSHNNCIPALHTAVSIQKNDIVYVLLTKGEVKLSRRLNFFFFFVFVNPDEVDVNKKQKRTRGISSHLDRTVLVNKGFIIWPERELFPAGPTRAIQSGQESCPLGHPRQVCSHLRVRLNLKIY